MTIKNGLYVYEVFSTKNVKGRKRTFEYYRKVATECGLIAISKAEDNYSVLTLYGTKWQFLKYELRTVKANRESKRTPSTLVTTLQILMHKGGS